MINVKAPRARALRNIAILPPVKSRILNNDRSNIGLDTLFSIKTKNTNREKPPIIKKDVSNVVIILKAAKVTHRRIINKPPANVAFPSQSIFSFLIVPSSLSLV